MAITACTSYNTAVITGFLPGSGASAGNVVTFITPRPVWTESDGTPIAIQCSAIAIG